MNNYKILYFVVAFILTGFINAQENAVKNSQTKSSEGPLAVYFIDDDRPFVPNPIDMAYINDQQPPAKENSTKSSEEQTQILNYNTSDSTQSAPIYELNPVNKDQITYNQANEENIGERNLSDINSTKSIPVYTDMVR
ncbi:MAG: hypothetical protein IJ730_01685 [Alphaproteobacteria bacterium]|nr:hypothetical protein [Alphaproteobacteria bacterium]